MTPEEQLDAATHAARAAAEGRIEDARRGFADALAGGMRDVEGLFLAFQFHFRIGEYDRAELLVEQRLDVLRRETRSGEVARAYANLSIVHLFAEKLNEAEHAAEIDGCDRGNA